MVGAIWRISGVGDGQDSNGHWVGMSYEHSSLLFSERRWHFKDSCKPGDVESLSSLEAMAKLDVPDKSRSRGVTGSSSWTAPKYRFYKSNG